MTDADSSEGGRQRYLSTFGERLAQEHAQQRAQSVDERNAEWRYHAELLVALLQLGLSISFLIGVVAIVYSIAIGDSALQLIIQTFFNGAGAILATHLKDRVANPDMGVGT